MKRPLQLAAFFRRHPVFTRRELADFLTKTGPRSNRAVESLLAYHTKTGHLVRVRRGLYAVIPPGADPASFPVDPFLLAARMTDDATLAYHTALEFHGAAYAVHERFTYLARRVPRPLFFRGHELRGVRIPRALLARGAEDFGILRAERGGLELRVTSLERTLVDVLDRPDLAGGWEEIWRSLEAVEFFDLERVVEYTLLLGNATTAAKVGFFLDQHRDTLMVEEAHLAPLLRSRPTQPHYLERNRRSAGRLVAGWNLVVPPAVLDRAWEEAA